VRQYLFPLLFFQRFFLPAVIGLVLWSTWRTVWRKDLAVGLALYIGIVIVVDGFLNTGLYIPGLDKGSIRYSEICAGFLLFNRPAASSWRAPHRAVCFLVGLYFSLLLLSTFRSDSIGSAIFEFRRIVIPQIIALQISMRGVRSQEDMRRFFLGLMAISVAVGLFVFFDLFFDRWLIVSDTLNSSDYSMNRQNGRYGSFFINPNYLGAFAVLIFPGAFMWALNEQSTLRKLAAAVGLLSLAFCLVETQSRGPLLAFGLALPLLLLAPAGEMSRTRRLGIFLPLAAVFILAMPGFYERASSRFGSLDEEMTTEAASRQAIWMYTLRMMNDYPIAGIGFGEIQFRNTLERYGFADQYGRTFDNPHNSYLQMTAYAGFPALFAFLAANGLLVLGAARMMLKAAPTRQTSTMFGLAVGITGFLATIYPDMHMFTQTVAPVYWVIFGLLLWSVTAVPEPARDVVSQPGDDGALASAGQLAFEPPSSMPARRRNRAPAHLQQAPATLIPRPHSLFGQRDNLQGPAVSTRDTGRRRALNPDDRFRRT
jgi:O-antigen ligase